jgi:hypothetical protein
VAAGAGGTGAGDAVVDDADDGVVAGAFADAFVAALVAFVVFDGDAEDDGLAGGTVFLPMATPPTMAVPEAVIVGDALVLTVAGAVSADALSDFSTAEVLLRPPLPVKVSS